MGEIVIGGTAALLICAFLSPKFISFLRVREFGQHIREEGPEGHHEKAGTPTMGGIIIFMAISAPFLVLTDYNWRSVAVYGRARQPCRRCGTPIRVVRQGEQARSTYWCPRCQPARSAR